MKRRSFILYSPELVENVIGGSTQISEAIRANKLKSFCVSDIDADTGNERDELIVINCRGRYRYVNEEADIPQSLLKLVKKLL